MRALLDEAELVLAGASVASPRSDAEWLLAHVLGTGRADLGFTDVSPRAAQEFRALIDQRADRVPLQHLTGSAAFRYRELTVGPGVFIPRPETELLAGWAVERAQAIEAPIVIDLCTGSGAIAGAVATEVSTAIVHAVELSESALAYARRNLADTGVDVRHGDFVDAFEDLYGRADIVVSNPPYIPLEAWESVEAEVRDHDPALALWSGDDGLDAIRRLESAAYRLLKPGGVVGVEHADVQGESAPAVFATTGRWADVRDHDDLAGRPRYVTGRRLG